MEVLPSELDCLWIVWASVHHSYSKIIVSVFSDVYIDTLVVYSVQTFSLPVLSDLQGKNISKALLQWFSTLLASKHTSLDHASS